MNEELKKLEEILANDRKIIEDNYKEIERLKELCDKYEEEHKTTFEEWKKTINIIKEVREYIESYINQFNGVYPPVDMRYLDLNKLLEMLEKER